MISEGRWDEDTRLCLSLPALILQKVGESVLNEERSWVPSALILLLTLPCNCRKGNECLTQEAGCHSGDPTAIWISFAMSQEARFARQIVSAQLIFGDHVQMPLTSSDFRKTLSPN